MIYEAGNVVIIPFPFVDSPQTKRRPAVVLSARRMNDFGYAVLAMITSAKRSTWPGDLTVDHHQLGLPGPCVVRLKLFTIDTRIVERTIGSLSKEDYGRLREILEHQLLP